eukprot:1618203-Prymnesium_polylepis.1
MRTPSDERCARSPSPNAGVEGCGLCEGAGGVLAERTNKKVTARAALLAVGGATLELLAADPSKD